MKSRISSYIKLLIYLCAMFALHETIAKDISVASDTSDEIKQVAITFDDGPHSIYTEKLLDGLKERNVVATFFVIGINVENNEDILHRMKEEGHLIGNHTYSHVELNKLGQEEQENEIIKTKQMIEDITGQNVKYIRPPFGSYDKEKAKEGMLGGMFVTLWDVDPRDWCVMDKNQVVENVIASVEDGDIILLHDIFETSVEAALDIIDILQEQGYEFVTVDQLVPCD